MATNEAVAAKGTPGHEMPEGLSLGLPNHWYPILHSKDLANKPICVERFGEELAVWRDSSGKPNAFENHCPHRRAPLSLGTIHGETLTCAYHGWKFDRSGACVEEPLEPAGATRNQRHGVKSYALEERGGHIWMFYGDRAKATPLRIPPELDDESWYSFNTRYDWDTNWLNVLDNVLDPLHAIYLHKGAVTQLVRAKFKEFRITREDESGFNLGKVGYLEDGSVGPVEGEVNFTFPNVVKLDIADGTAKGVYRVIIMPTPVNGNKVAAFYARARQGHGMERLRWRLWWARHSQSVHGVAAQDRDVMEGLGPVQDARKKEHLVRSDIGVARLRRRLSQAYRESEGGNPSHGAERAS